MGKGSLLTLSIHVFFCGRQALAVSLRACVLSGSKPQPRIVVLASSMNRTGRSRNSAGFSPLRTVLVANSLWRAILAADEDHRHIGDSARVRGGKIVESHAASIDLPAPGGPTRSMFSYQYSKLAAWAMPLVGLRRVRQCKERVGPHGRTEHPADRARTASTALSARKPQPIAFGRGDRQDHGNWLRDTLSAARST